MGTEDRKEQNWILVINGILMITVAVVSAIGICFGAGDGQEGTYIIGWGYFKPFTIDSNILAGVSAAVLVGCTLRNRKQGRTDIPRWAVTLQLMGATCLLLTFLVAACFLAPMRAARGGSYFALFRKDMFFFHLLNPVLCIISFCCLLRQHRFCKKDRLLGMLPTILYSFVYFSMVVIFRTWKDFYNFTLGGNFKLIPLVFLIIYSLVYTLSAVLVWLHNRHIRKA